MCKICIVRRLVVDIFPWCNANFVPFPSGTLVVGRMRNGSIRKNASSRICLDWFSWYLDVMIIRWGDKGCSEIWGQRSSRGHLEALFEYAQNASSSTWFYRFWWNLGEEILGRRFFHGVQEILIGGHLGVCSGHFWSLSFQFA